MIYHFTSFMTLDGDWGSIGKIKEAPDWIFIIFIMGAFFVYFSLIIGPWDHHELATD